MEWTWDGWMELFLIAAAVAALVVHGCSRAGAVLAHPPAVWRLEKPPAAGYVQLRSCSLIPPPGRADYRLPLKLPPPGSDASSEEPF